MAQKYPPQTGGPHGWSDPVWDNDNTDSQDEVEPQAGDDVDFTSSPTSATMEIAFPGTEAINTLQLAGGHLTTTGAGIPLLRCASFEIDTGGRFTLNADSEIIGDLDLSGGVFDMNAGDLLITGNFIYTSGTLTAGRKVTHSGTSNVNWNNAPNALDHYEVAAGASITRTGAVECRQLTVPSDVTVGASSAGNDFFVRPVTANAVSVAGTLTTAGMTIRMTTGSLSNSGELNVGVDNLIIESSDPNYVWTQSGKVTVISLLVRGVGSDDNAKLVLVGSGHALGAVTLGKSAATHEGFIDLGNGSGTIASLVTEGGAGDEHGFDFGQSSWVATGILNFTDIAVEVDVAAHLQGGDVRNLDSLGITGGVLHCHNTNDGGGSTAAIAAGEVTFDQHAPPGSLTTMGVGI